MAGGWVVSVRTAPAPTIGVEEEYLLIDPETALPVSVAEAVLERSKQVVGLRRDGDRGINREVGCDAHSRHDLDLQHELVRAQVEMATSICHGLDEVADQLREARTVMADAAEAEGAVLAPIGAAAVDAGLVVPVADIARYRRIAALAPGIVRENLICGMHVHVEVPNRDLGVTVINRLRRWWPVLTALAGNSPLWRGQDTGFASWRSIQTQRWPVAGCPPAFADAVAYDRHADWLVETGVAMDRAALYWSLRLAERYPTVEVRVPDVQLEVDEAVMIAGLVRGLVVAALAEAEAGIAESMVPYEQVVAACGHAARVGVSGELIDLSLDRPIARPAADVVASLVEHLSPLTTLRAELEQILPVLSTVLSRGGGATRQRAAWRDGGPAGLIALLQETRAR